MKSRVDEIIEALKPKPRCKFIVVDKEKGMTVENTPIPEDYTERDTIVYFVT